MLSRRVAREALKKSGDCQHELHGNSIKLMTHIKQTLALRQTMERAISELFHGRKINITGTSIDFKELNWKSSQ